ncbi:phosphatidylinositol phosphate synthase [Bowdeniella nasicola]|uniref:phosphatidylinositol phosphate synthase n=1 Tax=Bowdeniella nasicola TaxID=208480 RepID=UPI000ABC8116|nr:CDP-alcohol phosphatidyltransferase family protein [Bowdeniella nasicola]
MLGQHGRGAMKAVFTPLATQLVKLGVSPDAVTITGTVLASTAALALIAPGYLIVGSLTVGLVVFTDSLDGIMARLIGRESPWGAFLDSTLDRITDGAIFAALAIYFASVPGTIGRWGLYAGIAAAILGGVVPYARARAEAVGYTASVGIAERSDRLLIALLATLLVGLGLPLWVLAVALTYLAIAAAITVGQRLATVKKQAGA